MRINRSRRDKELALNFFTIYYGNSNPILNHSKQWVEAFGKHFKVVNIYATHVEPGLVETRETSNVREIGGGTIFNRLRALIRLISIGLKIISSDKQNVCLFHMTTTALSFMAPILKLGGVPIGLWYSHQATPLSLRLSLKLVDKVFSPTKNSFPIFSHKVLAVGHGLTPPSASRVTHKVAIRGENSIVVVGRIAAVKRIENLLVALGQIKTSNLTVECIGPVQDQHYLSVLFDIADIYGIHMKHLEPLTGEDFSEYLSSKSILYSGTEGSVDKAPLEAAALGCFVVSANPDLQDLSGMKWFWNKELGLVGEHLSIQKQINILREVKLDFESRNRIAKLCVERNDISNLSVTISNELKSLI